VGADRKKTNAARASHPSRIVIADVLPAVFRRGERSSRNGTPKSAACSRCSPEARASGLWFRVFHPSRKKDFVGGRKALGTGTLDMRRISPDDSLSKITGNAEP